MIRKVCLIALATAGLATGLGTAATAGPSNSKEVYESYTSCQKALERGQRMGFASPYWYCQPVSGGYSFYPQSTYDGTDDGTVYIPEEAPPPEDDGTVDPA